MPIRTGMAQGVIDALTSMGLSTGLTGVNWSLNWGGVDQYAEHSAWSMSGFGDKIEFSFTADAPGNGNQDIIFGNENSGFLILRIYNTTGQSAVVYTDIDGVTTRVFNGPIITAGVVYTGSIALNADGIKMLVNGVEYNRTDLINIASAQIIQAPRGGMHYFNGTINYLRYVNATALQAVNAVQGNGVDLYGVIPEITLTGDFEIEFWWRREDFSGASYQPIIGHSAVTDQIQFYDSAHASAPNRIGFVFSGGDDGIWAGALDDIAQGQDVKVRAARVGATAEIFLDDVSGGTDTVYAGDLSIDYIGWAGGSTRLAEDSHLYNLKITDKSDPDMVKTFGPELLDYSTVTGVGSTEVTDNGTYLTVDNPVAGSWFAEYGNTGISLEAGKIYLAEGRYKTKSGELKNFRINENAVPIVTLSSSELDVWEDFSVLYAAEGTHTVRLFTNEFISEREVELSIKEVTDWHSYGPYDLSGDNGDVIENTDPVTGAYGPEMMPDAGGAVDFSEYTTNVNGHDVPVGWGTYYNGGDPASIEYATVSDGTFKFEVAAGNSLGGFYVSGKPTASGLFVGKARYRLKIRRLYGNHSIGYYKGFGWRSMTLPVGEWVEFDDEFLTNNNFIIATNGGDTSLATGIELAYVRLSVANAGTWQNYDSGTDQVALPQLSRIYRMNDGPDATELVDSLGDGTTNATLFNVDQADWSK